MNLPPEKLKKEYIEEIKVIEANIKDIANGDAPQELYEYSQEKLDKLADRFQDNKILGTSRYKLYELQALLFYFQNDDDDALKFINQAIEMKGSTYKRAEQLINEINSTNREYFSLKSKSISHNQELPLQFQANIKSMRSSAIIMAVLTFLTIWLIPLSVFYIILAANLNPKKLPSRGLVLGASIVTIFLCFGIIPIIIDVEFWRMKGHLNRFEEQGSNAFISDEEYIAGEPKRRRNKIIGWSILIAVIAIFIFLITLIVVTNNSSSSSNNNLSTEKEFETQKLETKLQPKNLQKCNGTTITTNCQLKGVKYSTYVLHEAIPAVTHSEQVITYKKKVIGYCTLCRDSSYSPSCATGSGACSWHGGVAQWNAPEYSNVPEYRTKTITDSPAKKAYYEKITE